MERLRCAECGGVLSAPVRRVEMPAPPHWSLLDHHHVNPALLVPGTCAVDQAEHGPARVAGTHVLSPGDVRGTRFAHAWASTGCWSFDGWRPCVACEGCGTLVASRADDCGTPQNTRFDPDLVVWEDCAQIGVTHRTRSPGLPTGTRPPRMPGREAGCRCPSGSSPSRLLPAGESGV